MTKKFTAEEIEHAAQHMAKYTGMPLEKARELAIHRAGELEAQFDAWTEVSKCPLILKEITPVSESMPQYWSSRAIN